jgi:hypothetical protein
VQSHFDWVRTSRGWAVSGRIATSLDEPETAAKRVSLGIVFRHGRSLRAVNDAVAHVDPVRFITVLSVSRMEEDHLILDRTFRESVANLYPNCRLRLVRCSDPACAISALRGAPIPIVVCDAGEDVRVWQQLAREIRGLSQPPCLILLSSTADDRLCASASKHGVYEVVARPLRGSEVLRVINLAWRHWQDRYGLPAAPQSGKPSTGA